MKFRAANYTRSVYGTCIFFEYKVFHAGKSDFLTWLAEQHHQHYPLDLLYIDIRAIQCHQPVQYQFTLGG